MLLFCKVLTALSRAYRNEYIRHENWVSVMKNLNRQKNRVLKTCCAAMFAGSAYVNAAPGVLQDVPLTIGTYVQPNILFLIDDSGSMSWEVLKSEGANAVYADNRNSGSIDYSPTPITRRELLEACSAYNVMYYDPDKTYTPWMGSNIDGVPFANIDPTSAPDQPYYNTGIQNLTLVQGNGDIAGYISSRDLDGDGEFDAGDCYDDGTTDAEMYANFVPITAMNAAQRTNFANWFSYYRKREFVVKRALSEIIDNNTSRVGLATLHNNNDVGTPIKDIDNVNLEDTTVTEANKQALLTKLFEVDSSGSTPLRNTLNNAGLYFTETVEPAATFFGASKSFTGSDTISNSPILNNNNGGSCQQNFSILFSDGEWNNGFSADYIGNNDNDGVLIDGSSPSSPSIFDSGNFGDDHSNTLADIAMHYLEIDLAPGLSDSVNVTDIRQNDVLIKHQHMTTYTVAFGVKGSFSDDVNDTTTTGDTGGANDPSSDAFTGWPKPIDRATKIDDLRHAAWNGRGGYLDAETPETLIETLGAAVDDIEARTATATSVSFNSGSINDETLVFLSRFATDDWSGDVLAYRFDEDGIIDINSDGDITDADAVWSADDKLSDSLNNSGTAGRNIITYSGVDGVPFAFPENYSALLADADNGNGTISDEMIIDLLDAAPFEINTPDTTEQAENQAYGVQIVNFLKGDTTNEVDDEGVGLFRSRGGNTLGAFIYSSPQYLAAPNESYPNLIEGVDNMYDDFRTDNIDRAPLIFVGGNAGMLHAFDASDDPTTGGKEVFAYVPGMLTNNLHSLAVTSTGYSHRSYVDSSPTIADVFVKKNNIGNEQWRTYLVGGLRTGGQGVYVLDVSDPDVLKEADNSVANASKVLVDEFTDERMGYSFSRPQIAKLNNGRWAAIFGNGYNNEGDGKAHLFILYLDNGEHKRIEASESAITYLVNDSCFDTASNCNGLSSPSLADLNGDAIVDRVYAGDLHGNLWVFDLSGADDTAWNVAFTNSTVVEPLFTACETETCDINNRQPITTKPVVRFHPSRNASSTDPNIMVYFGTGQLMATGDNLNTDLQSFYGVWDAGVNKKDGTTESLTKINLEQQVFTSDLDITSEEVNFNISDEFGWYVDLTITGDDVFNGARSVNTPIVLGSVVFFLISIPDEAACSITGTSYLAALDLLDGSRVGFNVFDSDDDGIPDSSSPLTVQDGNVVGVGSIDNKIVTTKNNIGNKIEVGVTDTNTKSSIPKGRKSWSIIR